MDNVKSILRVCKTLAGKSLANQRSIHQIHQCFPPPTFHAIWYHKSGLLIGDDNTEDGMSYMAFTTDEGVQWL